MSGSGKYFVKKVLFQPELAQDQRFASNFKRNEYRQALKAIIDECFAHLTIQEVEQRLDDAQIANARMNDMAGFWNHQQLKARNRWQQVDSPVGELPALLPLEKIMLSITKWDRFQR
jgi:crotonobetainyl-CoA:carnitine CoA-transferase CaiB-like acyl-CoA transferase